MPCRLGLGVWRRLHLPTGGQFSAVNTFVTTSAPLSSRNLGIAEAVACPGYQAHIHSAEFTVSYRDVCTITTLL
jgi:hypothetical protein